MPVYRVPGTAKASVYAYANEVDRWLESAQIAESKAPTTLEEDSPLFPVAEFDIQPQPAIAPTSVTRFSPRVRRKWLFVALAFLLAVVTLDVAVRLGAVSLAGKLRRMVSGRQSAVPHAVASETEAHLANDFYLRGRYEWNQRTPESLHRALDLFTQAIVHDPSDARAYAGLADTYDLLREYSTDADNDAFPRAVAAAKKAVALNDSLAEAHRALAFAEMYGLWDFAGAETEFRRAIELDPKDPQARRWFANALGVGGRFPEALAQMDKAQELDPSSDATLADKGWMLYNANHPREGIELLREVERSSPEFYSPHSYLMQIALDLRDYPSFLSEAQLAAESSNDPAFRDIIAASRAGYAHDTGRGLLQALYTKEKFYYDERKTHATMLARACVLMGKRQEALDAMEDAYRRKDIEVLAFLSEHSLLSLKDEPRYQALAREINFPPAPPHISQR